jgi:hypothetical protein
MAATTKLTYRHNQDRYTFMSFTNAHGGPVEDLTFELTCRRLASVGHGSLQVWELKSDRKKTTTTFEPHETEVIPDALRPLHPLTERIPMVSRSVQFADRGDSVLVFYLESHEVYVLYAISVLRSL